ncbi:MAG: hypothetical protein OCD00_02875 [Colwellia sp.]
MNQLIIAGIQASIRAAQAGADLYAEHAKNQPIFLPNLKLPDGSKIQQLNKFLIENNELLNSIQEFKNIWDPEQKFINTLAEEPIESAYAMMLEHKAKLLLISKGADSREAEREAQLLSGGRIVEQWRESRKPPSAFARMALTLTDIGLEFVSSNPSILGLNSKGEKFIVSFANQITTLIPNNVNAFGTKANFADRVVGIFVRAGLSALISNSDTIFEDDDIKKLVTGIVEPIVNKLPETIAEQLIYRDIVDTILGPAAEAALSIISQNTSAYFGKKFGDEKALGAITSALFENASKLAGEQSVIKVFSEQGAVSLYKSMLKVAIDQPTLFINTENDSAKAKLLSELFSGSAQILYNHPRFKGPMASALTKMVVESVASNAPQLLKLDLDKPWEQIATSVLTQISSSITKDLENEESLLSNFSDGQLFEFVKIVLTQVTKTPSMLGSEKTEINVIISGISQAMLADEHLLLTNKNWLKIAAVAAEKASLNPARLFNLNTQEQSDALAVIAIKSVLTIANNSWQDTAVSSLLFSDTLHQVMEVIIKSLAGNIKGLVQHATLIDDYLEQITTVINNAPTQWGSDNLVLYIQSTIAKVLATGELPQQPLIDLIPTNR